MIKYIGSKRVLLPAILSVVETIPRTETIADLFSGTARVAHALKRRGYRVLANDHNAYAHTLATCYAQADAERHTRDAALLIEELNTLPGNPDYITQTYCEQARYFTPRNGARIDAIREAIAQKSLNPELEAILLTSLLEAADRVDSTTGVQMAYLKSWAPRAHNELKLRVPDVLPSPAAGPCEAHRLDAVDAARMLEADVVYIDPPYNQHSYLGNYHIWETLVLWDKPETYGIARKRLDCRDRKSDFNSKRRFRQALTDLLHAVRAPVLIVSFNNEGFIERADMESLLSSLHDGENSIKVIEHDHKRYVGAQIGIHNSQGLKVGRVSHLRNKEYLYIVTREPAPAPTVTPA